ncbi:MAG: DNA-processing protein DprA, partial [Candidatus Veblenbacteria bacterium]|nr:DNA-processing protein DprA [Candidatus Veblenbacteria bacterium]
SENPELPYWLALTRCLKLGPKGFALLRGAFPTMSQVWGASRSELLHARLEVGVVEALLEHRRTTDVAQSWGEVERLGLQLITITDEHYPKLLKEIYDPPALLFARGDLATLEGAGLAVVGTRQATSYGLSTTKDLVAVLARSGFTIISGLAYGIDTAAHRATLEAGGRTVAVMASGLDEVYPTANRHLAHDIVQHGGLWLSEFPPGTAPLKQNFPYRNRIIAGLSRGTLVIEAAPGSGALLTAKHALEANREVFAVPGNITSPTAAGTNELLKQGAHLVTSAEDILNVFGLAPAATVALPTLEPELEQLLQAIPREPIHLDNLARNLQLPVSVLAPQLTLLELKGYLRDVGGQQYIRVV